MIQLIRLEGEKPGLVIMAELSEAFPCQQNLHLDKVDSSVFWHRLLPRVANLLANSSFRAERQATRRGEGTKSQSYVAMFVGTSNFTLKKKKQKEKGWSLDRIWERLVRLVL